MSTDRLSINREQEVKRHEGKIGALAFWIGIAFCFIFTWFIWFGGARLSQIALLPDKGATWYYWQLPAPTLWSQVTAWGGYILHQLFMWGTIFYAQRRQLRYTSGLHRINVYALLGNALFIVLHFIQTQLWYDGLAQNVPLASSEVSVILLLVMVLLMENRRRGLFFGKKVPISKEIIDFCRHYHGYLFAWALVYTFWFHPMVATSGHLVGFFYMFLLLLQGSLFYTRIHTNRWWNIILELLVLVHAAMVIYMLRADAVWAFVLGFFGVFLITQMHGLKLNAWLRWGVVVLYLVSVFIAYGVRGPTVIRDMLLIPALEYGLLFILAAIVGSGIVIRRWLARN